MNQRTLVLDGCKNVRDLGGLPAGEGRLTRMGAMIRADTPSRLTPAGWAALYEYGVRTILTLRTHGLAEDELNVTSPYPNLETIEVAIEDVTDREFVERWASTDFWCTPLYYKDALQRWPERHASAISAIAQARSGGVLFHCVRGNDRTGMISMLLLTLVGVHPEAIIADYALSPDPDRDEILARVNSSVPDAIFSALEGLNIETYLIQGGCSPADLTTVRNRLLGE